MFESLGDRLTNAINKIKGYGKITEDNISEVLREIRLALLEADVNYQVVKEFTNNIKEKALGEEVKKSLKPSELFIKIVKDELTELLGGNQKELKTNGFTTIMMCGLQGSGKTTTTAKLGLHLRKKYKKNPMFIACDVYRPAAIDQLIELGKQTNIFVYTEDSKDPVNIANNGIKYAHDNNYDLVIIDTAGRLQIDEKLMNELDEISKNNQIDETLLVIDSMMGQDAINVINGFNDKLTLTGAILTKLDSNTKGGVALSVRYLTSVPIKFIGTSEKLDGLSEFYPDRMASRILDMGDLLSVVEKAENIMDEAEAKNLTKKMNSGKFDLEDFLLQLKQIKKLGPIENLIKMMPGAKKAGISNINVDPKVFSRIEAIVLSMTPKERKNPDIIKSSRKERIAKGSGTTIQEVNKLLNQFEEMKKMMKLMKNKNFKMPF